MSLRVPSALNVSVPYSPAHDPLAADNSAACGPTPAAGVSFAGQTVVCIITGNGLKDPETALRIEPDVHRVPASLAAIEHEMGWG